MTDVGTVIKSKRIPGLTLTYLGDDTWRDNLTGVEFRTCDMNPRLYRVIYRPRKH